MNQKFPRPNTPMLDAARAEAAQLAQWEAEQRARAEEQAREREAREATRAERERVAREQFDECVKAAHDVYAIADQLVAALDRYIAAAPVLPYELQARIASVLQAKLGRFGPIQSYGAPDLLDGLTPAVRP